MRKVLQAVISLMAGVVAPFGPTTVQAASKPTLTAAIEIPAAPAAKFAADDITTALRNRGYRIVASQSAALRVVFTRDATLKEEGFALRVTDGNRRVFTISSRDVAGAMYGGLELGEQIRTGGVEHVADTARDPYLAMRGTKFNIPLDLRTPSYTDMSDSAQANIATVWDFEFWREYLDQLARHRYNYVSLWNLHPFPSMVRVPEFPDVALNDVWRTRATLAEDYSTRTTDLLSPRMLADKQVLKKLTIEQKIDFWRRVMQHAHERNIAFYVITWNVFTYGVDGQYGITDAIDNPKTVAYFRASVREMFRTYPLLAGIGLTAGENMGEVRMYSGGVDSFDAKENWLFATYGQGILDAARAQPQRQFRLIHRQHESRAQDIAATFKPVIDQPNVDFVFSFKYAQAHALSSTTQTFHHGYLESLGDLKTLWTIRNDDALLYRWAAPDFVREFVRNIPRAKTQGYYVGSDMWVWGREFLARAPKLQGQLEINKHWLHFLLWGRLAYDPGLDNQRIAALIARRHPGVDAHKLLAAWQDASMVYPLVTGFHWADFDFQWYIEGCRSRPGPANTASGFHSVDTFINQKVHPGTDNISIPRYVAGITSGDMPRGITPLQVADQIDARANAARTAAASFLENAQDAELQATLADIRIMAALGKYYAAKIRGATDLALYRQTRKAEHQARAVAHLRAAQRHWEQYTSGSSQRYRNPLWTNRVGIVDWRELDSEVANDVLIAEAALP